MTAGRPRKPTESHKLAGTYRADRHAGGLDALIAASVPVKPSYFHADTAKVWDAIIAAIPAEALSSLDTWALEQCAVSASMSRWHAELLQGFPADEDSQKAFLKFSDKFERLAARFGLTPADRAKIKAGAQVPDDDPLSLLGNLTAPGEN